MGLDSFSNLVPYRSPPLADALPVLSSANTHPPGLYTSVSFCHAGLALRVFFRPDFKSKLLGVLFNIVLPST